jgi:hypothetical protein
MAHHEYLGPTVLCGFFVKLQSPVIEPTRPGVFIIMEAEPDVLELTDLRTVPTPAQINDVGYPEGPKLLGVAPGRYRATECQSLTDEKDLHLNRLPPSVLKVLGV